ncbi:SRPBCC family protein [Ruegeria atlantica]|uniref:SRPBCC family protein n=1 Tax=Ruegeria atlantica TaxID=81569 RepID=UPI00147C1932|nr:SRPBCC domain-containing protein [Ruegeria atlantica]
MQGLRLTLKEFYPHPVETVWQALTDPVAIAEWLMPCDFRPNVGHRFSIRGAATNNWRGLTECVVIEVEPPRRMVWQWVSADIPEPTRVCFELEPVDGGTQLTMSHIGMTTQADIESLSQGWPMKLKQLCTFLSNSD